MRVRALNADVVSYVERDGKRSAELHGASDPGAGEQGDRIVSNVPLPAGAVLVTNEDGATLADMDDAMPFAVQAVRWRARGWEAEVHRVVKFMESRKRTSAIVAASPWEKGAWDGDSVVSEAFDPGLPPEARPA